MAHNDQRSISPVAHNCYGKTKKVTANQIAHGKTKKLKAKPNSSRKNQKANDKTK